MKRAEDKTFKDLMDEIPSTYLTSIKQKKVIIPDNTRNIVESKEQKLLEKEIFPTKSIDETRTRKRIKEIKSNLNQKHFKISNLYDQKYLNMIEDSNKIIKERQDSKKNEFLNDLGKPNTLHNFVNDNKEITIKNYMIQLLKSERKNLDLNEIYINKALRDSVDKLAFDKNIFSKFKDDLKLKHRDLDGEMSRVLKEGMEYYESNKKLSHENKHIMDELHRMIKMIFNLKEYAVFVHRVLDNNFFRPVKLMKKVSESIFDKIPEFNYKDGDLEKVVDKIM
jgi:hypothetical protein